MDDIPVGYSPQPGLGGRVIRGKLLSWRPCEPMSESFHAVASSPSRRPRAAVLGDQLIVDTTLRGYEFVFVGGMHRSGTTYLADSIASGDSATGLAHSGAHMGEGQFLQDVFPLDNQIGMVTGWALDGRAHLTDGDIQSKDEIAERLWRAWSPHWDLSKKYLVEKTPNNMTKTRYLQAVFPNSRFIIITRHPICQALAIRKWSHRRTQRFGAQFEALVANWLEAHACLRKDQPFVRRLLVVRFEDLVLRPAPVLERVEDFLEGHGNTPRWEALDRESAFRYARVWHTATAPGGRIQALLRVPKHRASTRERAKAYVQGIADALVLPRVARQIAERYGSEIADYGYDLDNLYEAAPGR